MTFLVTILHVLACLALIMIVLLQTGKGADIGASMGGAGGQAMFGTSTATTLLGKITTGIAVLFMLTSLYLAYQSGHKVKASVMDNVKPAVETTTVPEEAPALPVPDATPAADQGDAEGETTAN